MAKERSEAELKERKEKKDKKRKREEASGLDADAVSSKKEKKEKKARAAAAEAEAGGEVAIGKTPQVDDEDDSAAAASTAPRIALVPFAHPLADEKAQKKILKAVKRAAKNKTLKRGVKECVKAIRKSSPSAPPGVVIIAGDVSPMDVISHLNVLCEEHNIPYVYVPSRVELGLAGSTKRPTSIVLVTAKPGKTKAEEADSEWDDTYKDLHKLLVKLGATVRV